MEYAVRRFARNILLIHFALLAAVLAVVISASRAIEQTARDQALLQAQGRQELLASQTARGIEQFYQGILNDMDLVPREDEAYAGLNAMLSHAVNALLRHAPAQSPQRGAPRGRGPMTPRATVLGTILGRQLEDRVSHLFVVDRNTFATRDVVTQPAPGDGPTPDEIVARYQPWLGALDRQSVSPFELFDTPAGRHGLNLVCLPVARGTAIVVAAVPVAKIDEKFLAILNGDENTGAFLINESLTAMAASRPELVGANLGQSPDPQVRASLDALTGNGFKGTLTLPAAFKLGDETFAPAVVTAEPIDVVPGRRWFVLVASPASEVDRVVSGLFDRITLWAAFLTLAVAGILVSTSVTLIRGRVRLERVRHEVLTRELERARQIQQAWLPREGPRSPVLDVAAVNFPANHISGDFYNWFELPDGRTVVAIGDVTGHGMSAAFLMATTQLLVRTTMQMRGITDPGRCLEEVNGQLCSQVYSGQFVTMQILVFDDDGSRVEIATAGHPRPWLARGGAFPTFELLDIEPEFVLGVETDVAYETISLALDPDSMLLLYTDGTLDAEAPDGRRLGNDGLQRALPARLGDARSLIDAVVLGVNAFRAHVELCDDLTLVAIRLSGAPALREAHLAEAI